LAAHRTLRQTCLLTKIFIDFHKIPTNGTTIRAMPRQNTCPADFPPFILSQIEHMAQRIVAARKARGETQAQWAQQLGISQPTMARLERGDPAIATATYVMCLWLVNPQLNLLQLLDSTAPAAAAAVSTPPHTVLPGAPDANADIAPMAQPPHSPADEFASLLAQWNNAVQ
jgi:DNA-binding XRE family transcriptional regulator